MSQAGNDNQDPLAWARQFQAEQVAYLTKGDVDGLLRHVYSHDARMASSPLKISSTIDGSGCYVTPPGAEVGLGGMALLTTSTAAATPSRRLRLTLVPS